MKKLYKILIFFSISLFISSCSEEIEDNNPDEIKKNEEVSKEENIEVLFNETTFSDASSLKLLKELGHGICNPVEKDEHNFLNPPCSSKFFKLFDFKENTKIDDAFILLIKSNVHNFPLRRVYIYQRENGKLVKVNSFVANLIGKRKSNTAYQDLILRFVDKDQNHFNCVYAWKNMHYEYDRVEQINDANIKAEFQDSMNLEILKVIEDNGMQNI
ncbi:MAG: hypothetical protein V4622_01830 [Bacteroidota bacterium]